MTKTCKICVAKKGLTLDSKHIFKTDDEFYDHLEAEHHTPVNREGETKKQAMDRFLKKYPEAVNCPDCIDAGAEWTINREAIDNDKRLDFWTE